MFNLRFNQVFVGLLALSFLSAFVIPPRFTNPVRNIQGLFSPVSRPARSVASRWHDRFAPPIRDNRPPDAVYRENEELRQMLLSVSGQLEQLKRINQDREQLGDTRPLCTPVPVVGSDPGTRDSLSLQGAMLQGLTAEMPVLYPYGVVGRIDRVGPGGAQVRLVTDPDFRATARFYRRAGGKGHLEAVGTTAPVVFGAGKGMMLVKNIPLKETHPQSPDGLVVGDTLALDDPEWPTNLRGKSLGRIEKIEPMHDAPLFARIEVRPLQNLATLREVMVFNPGKQLATTTDK